MLAYDILRATNLIGPFELRARLAYQKKRLQLIGTSPFRAACKAAIQVSRGPRALSIVAHASVSMFQPRDRFDQNLLERDPQRQNTVIRCQMSAKSPVTLVRIRGAPGVRYIHALT
jgi:hypothetical protein